jgi:RimJ/RimL family protein N-acetyltransferase
MMTVVLAENQIPVSEYLEKAGAAVNIGPIKDRNPKDISQTIRRVIESENTRSELSRRSRLIVDGLGAWRVARFIREIPVTFRKATLQDNCLVFEWINEPYVRNHSFNPSPITPEEHNAWYSTRMQDPDCRYFIILDRDSVPAGQVRYDITGTDATISILIGPEHRGRSIATQGMRLTAEEIFKETTVNRIHAYIKTTNYISCKAFANAGFVFLEMTKQGSMDAYHLLLSRTGTS